MVFSFLVRPLVPILLKEAIKAAPKLLEEIREHRRSAHTTRDLDGRVAELETKVESMKKQMQALQRMKWATSGALLLALPSFVVALYVALWK